MTVISVQAHVRDLNSLLGTSVGALPYILGETNSLYNEGRPGLSNAFGAALWGVDFNLYCASQNITRVVRSSFMLVPSAHLSLTLY